MSGPRHLWSGDWEQDSSARAAELAAQRARAAEPDAPETPETEPAATPRSQPTKTLRDRLTALRASLAATRRRHARQLRLGLLIAVLALVGAGAAYAVANTVTGGSNSQQQASSGPGNTWLGVEMVSSPSGGVMVARVAPKSPAEAAGIKPGDVITQIDTQPIVTPAIVAATLDGLQPGDHVDIQVQRGSGSYTAHVTLASPPKASR